MDPLLQFSLFLILLSTSTAIHFSQEYFEVWFDPYVDPRGNITSDKELVSMLSKISSEFRNILYPIKEGKPYYVEPEHNLPTAVANFNKFHKRPEQQPLQLTVQFYPDSWGNGKGFGSLDLVKKLANEANRIFPETVQMLLLGNNELSWDNLNSTLGYLQIVQSKISESDGFQYKLGLSLPFSVCGLDSITSLEPYLIPLLPLAQHIIIINYPKLDAFRSGLSITTWKFTQSLEMCKAKIIRHSSTTQVGFLTRWPVVPNDMFAHYSDVAMFWKGMNVWAVKTNTRVTLDGAFDGTFGNAGWWRLLKNAKYGNDEELVFESKEEAYLNREYFNKSHVAVWFEPYGAEGESGTVGRHTVEGIIRMVRTISQRFGTIVMHEIKPDLAFPEGNDILKIPKAVALFNKNMLLRDQQSVELIMQFEWDYSKSDKDQWSFQTVKALASEANLIFPGTVKTILFNRANPDGSFRDKLAFVKSETNTTTEPDYDFGIILSHLMCEHRGKLHPLLSHILPYLNVIIFDMDYNLDINFGNNVSQATGELRRLFNSCNDKLKRYNPAIKSWFQAGWPNTDNMDVRSNLSNLVYFWQDMSEWAVSAKSNIVLYQAFDSFPLDGGGYSMKNPGGSIKGWWRLVQGSGPYTNTTEPVLEEKRETEYMKTRSIVPFLTSTTSEGITFNRKITGVWFTPKVSQRDSSRDVYSIEEMIILVSKITSKFSVILMPAITNQLPDADLFEIPLAVARFNKNYKPQTQPDARLVMQFGLDGTREEEGAEQTSFKRVKGLADEANLIYPGTVQMLLLPLPEQHIPYNLVIEQVLAAASSPNISVQIPYKIGVVLPLDKCTRSDSDPFIANLLARVPLLRYIMFRTHETGRSYKELNTHVKRVTREVEVCKEKVKLYNELTEVGLLTGWSDDGSKGMMGAYNLVTFWQRMDEWAVATNTSLFLDEAFDNPRRAPPLDAMGWWQLLVGNNDTYRHAGDYVFQSKENSAEIQQYSRNEEEVLSPDPNESEKGFSPNPITAAYLVTGIILLTLIIGLATATYLHNRLVSETDRTPSTLAKKDIRGFFEGNSSIFPTHPATLQLPVVAYDHRLEIPRGSFDFDEGCVLGSGTFGQVFKGKIFIQEIEVKVAVKTIRPLGPSSALKNILSEIKVMSYIGKHEHIVGIAGAYTAELAKGKVFLFSEFCALGSLESYLRKTKRPKLGVNVEDESLSNHEAAVKEKCDDDPKYHQSRVEAISQDLQKWSHEIVLGMEYLASKHVVHADIATRNVLLTEEKIAKISDFGLSRRLYNYEDYVRSNKEPLPWRWMSPESLSRMIFNQKTDVWSCGITLWEIFSLGDIPYPGMSWNTGWVTRLNEGLRLEKPTYDLNGIHAIMVKCWDLDPSARPSFTELKELLNKICYVTVI